MRDHYFTTADQVLAEAKLTADGFTFSHWVPADPDADGLPLSDFGCRIYVKHPGPGRTHYREVEPDGTIR